MPTLISKLFRALDYLASLISRRLAQRIRTSSFLHIGHFYKWWLGDGEDCFWCKLCREHPAARRIVPYTWEYQD